MDPLYVILGIIVIVAVLGIASRFDDKLWAPESAQSLPSAIRLNTRVSLRLTAEERSYAENRANRQRHIGRQSDGLNVEQRQDEQRCDV